MKQIVIIVAILWFGYWGYQFIGNVMFQDSMSTYNDVAYASSRDRIYLSMAMLGLGVVAAIIGWIVSRRSKK